MNQNDKVYLTFLGYIGEGLLRFRRDQLIIERHRTSLIKGKGNDLILKKSKGKDFKNLELEENKGYFVTFTNRGGEMPSIITSITPAVPS